MKHVLDLPYGFDAKPFGGKVHYDRARKVYIWEGSLLPAGLRPYTTMDYSRQRWAEDELNLSVMPPQKPTVVFTPRDHQLEAGREIAKSYFRGDRGFLEADKTGLGKTLSTLHGVCVIAKKEGFQPKNKAKLLVVCPKGVIPQWRNTLRNYPISSALLRTMVINYQQLNNLIIAPPANKLGKKAKTRNRSIAKYGKSSIEWDYIIFDEAHYLKNYPSSATSLAATTIAKLNRPYQRGKIPYTIYSTATPGATPLNFSLMAGWLAPLLSVRPEAKLTTPDTWGEFLRREKFHVKEGKVTWSWAPLPFYGKNSEDPKELARYKKALGVVKRQQRLDTQRIGRALMKPQAPFIMRSPSDLAGWPEQQIIPLPVEMTARQRPIYEEAWTRFRNWLNLTPAKSDPKGGLVEMLRYRQKTSLLKVDQVVDNVIDWVETGNQVFISVEFIETLEWYRRALEKAKIPVAEISGRNTDDRENERIRFQKGEAKVCICTVVAGISLHSNEILPDGTKATPDPRITVLSDVRQNNLDSTQAIGRAHRDGENSVTYIPFLMDTVDERVMDSFANKTSNMNSMMGDGLENAEAFERMYREAAAKGIARGK